MAAALKYLVKHSCDLILKIFVLLFITISLFSQSETNISKDTSSCQLRLDSLQVLKEDTTVSLDLLSEFIESLDDYCGGGNFEAAKEYGRHGYRLGEKNGDFDKALLFYEKAYSIIINNHKEETSWITWLNARQGNIHTRKGEYDKAELFISKTIEIYLSKKEYEKAARAHINLAICYQSAGNINLANIASKEGIRLAKLDGSAYAEFANRINLSKYLIENDSIETARKEILKCQTLLVNINNSKQKDALENFYQIEYLLHKSDKKYFEAIESQKKYINTLFEIYGNEQRREFTKAYIDLGYLFLALDDLEGTRGELSKAIRTLTGKGTIFPHDSEYYAENSFLEINQLFSRYQKAQYLKRGNTKYLDSIILSSTKGLYVLGLMQNEFKSKNSKLISNRERKIITSQAIDAYNLLQNSIDSMDFYKVDHFFIQSKGAVLSEEMNINANLYLLSEKDNQTYIHNKSKIAHLQKTNSSRSTSVLDSILNLESQNQKITHSILNKVQFLDENYIDYLFGLDEIFVFGKIKNEILFQSLGKTEELEKLLLKFDKLKFDLDREAELKVILHQLYTMLIKPVGDLPYSINIIQDGKLVHLPFDILIDDNNNYLIHNHNITSRISRQIISSEENKMKKVACIYPEYNASTQNDIASLDRAGIYTLPFAKEEVDYINNKYDNVILRREIESKSLANILDNIDILHYAGHAKVNDNQAYLIVDNSNNRITGNEISAIPSKANLVILSACETGLGKVMKGEGVLSLARSFIEGGSNQVINSLWTVNDQTTSYLMKSFYDKLSKTENVAESLRQAKIDFINDPEFENKHPYYWGGFVYTSVLDVKPRINFYAFILPISIGLLLVLFLLFFMAKLKSK